MVIPATIAIMAVTGTYIVIAPSASARRNSTDSTPERVYSREGESSISCNIESISPMTKAISSPSTWVVDCKSYSGVPTMSIRTRFADPELRLANFSSPAADKYPVANVPGSAGNSDPLWAY